MLGSLHSEIHSDFWKRSICLFVLRYSLSTIPLPGLGVNQYSRALMCLAPGHNIVSPVGIEARTSIRSPMFYH